MAALTTQVPPAQIAARAKTPYTAAGASLTDGVVAITAGRITAVGPAATTAIPDGHRVLDNADGAKPPAPDLGKDALLEVLDGRVPLLVTAHRARDLRAALRLADEFGIRVVLDGAAEAHLELDAIRTAGVPVIAHAPMLRARGDAENATLRLGAILGDAGVPFAYQPGFEGYVPKTRVVLFEAAMGATHGLGFDAALRAITIDAARIVGVADRVGSIEVGKDGDLALFDGDPFEWTSHCIGTVIDGRVVAEGAH